MIPRFPLLVAVVLLAGCTPAPKPSDDGTSPVVVIQTFDGMLTPGSRWVLPEFALFGDRTAIVPADRHGMVLAGDRRTLTRAEVAALLGQADEAALNRDITYRTLVEDGGVLEIRVRGHVTRVEFPQARDRGLRGRIAEFRATAPTLGEPTGPYVPRTAAVILLSEFRPDLTDVRPWPLSTVPAVLPGGPYRPCVTVTGAELTRLTALLRTAGPATRWTSGGTRYQLLMRPLLPYEHTCADF
jgi:hypothetical protein